MFKGDRCEEVRRKKRRTVFLEVIVSLEAAAQPIKGLACLTDPESNGVDCFHRRTHPLLLPIPQPDFSKFKRIFVWLFSWGVEKWGALIPQRAKGEVSWTQTPTPIECSRFNKFLWNTLFLLFPVLYWSYYEIIYFYYFQCFKGVIDFVIYYFKL